MTEEARELVEPAESPNPAMEKPGHDATAEERRESRTAEELAVPPERSEARAAASPDADRSAH